MDGKWFSKRWICVKSIVIVKDERRDAARLLYHLGFLKNTVPDIARHRQAGARGSEVGFNRREFVFELGQEQRQTLAQTKLFQRIIRLIAGALEEAYEDALAFHVTIGGAQNTAQRKLAGF